MKRIRKIHLMSAGPETDHDLRVIADELQRTPCLKVQLDSAVGADATLLLVPAAVDLGSKVAQTTFQLARQGAGNAKDGHRVFLGWQLPAHPQLEDSNKSYGEAAHGIREALRTDPTAITCFQYSPTNGDAIDVARSIARRLLDAPLVVEPLIWSGGKDRHTVEVSYHFDDARGLTRGLLELAAAHHVALGKVDLQVLPGIAGRLSLLGDLRGSRTAAESFSRELQQRIVPIRYDGNFEGTRYRDTRLLYVTARCQPGQVGVLKQLHHEIWQLAPECETLHAKVQAGSHQDRRSNVSEQITSIFDATSLTDDDIVVIRNRIANLNGTVHDPLAVKKTGLYDLVRGDLVRRQRSA